MCGSCIWLESWRIVCVSSCPRLDDGGNMGVGIFFVWNAIPVQQTSLHKTGGGVSRQLVYVTGTQWRPAQCKHVPPQMEWRICGGLHDKRTKASQKWTWSLSCWTNDLLFPHLKLLKQYLLFCVLKLCNWPGLSPVSGYAGQPILFSMLGVWPNFSPSYITTCW